MFVFLVLPARKGGLRVLNIEAMIAAGREKKEAIDVTAARESAYAGDVEEAEHLVGLLPNARRGEEVKNAYRTRVPSRHSARS